MSEGRRPSHLIVGTVRLWASKDMDWNRAELCQVNWWGHWLSVLTAGWGALGHFFLNFCGLRSLPPFLLCHPSAMNLAALQAHLKMQAQQVWRELGFVALHVIRRWWIWSLWAPVWAWWCLPFSHYSLHSGDVKTESFPWHLWSTWCSLGAGQADGYASCT